MSAKKSIDELALEFAQVQQDRIRYCARRRTWYLRAPNFNNFWERDNRLSVPNSLREFLRDRGGASPSRIAAVEKLCRMDPRLAARGDEL